MLARILAHLATVDERRAAERLAFPSLYAYCTRQLGYSEAEAYLRIRAARAARAYPRILTMIARGEIHITAIARIAPHLTPENHRSLLAKAARRTQEQLDRLLAELAPQPERRPVIRALSAGSNFRPTGLPQGTLFLRTETAGGVPGENEDAAPAPTGNSAGRLSRGERAPQPPVGRVLFHFVASEMFRAKYKRARELLWHKHPQGFPENIFDDALEALLDKKDPARRMARMESRRMRTAERIWC